MTDSKHTDGIVAAPVVVEDDSSSEEEIHGLSDKEEENTQSSTTPQGLPSEPTPTQAQKTQREEEISRYERIMRSIQSGHAIVRVCIPSYYQAEDYIVYEVEVSNKKIRWNVWHRFDSFYMLHHMLLEIAASLSQNMARYISLPPFPEKRVKYITDHFEQEFIENRRMLLENYIKKVLVLPDFKHSNILTSFLTPDIDEIVLPPAQTGGRQKPIDLNDVLDVDEDDEITTVSIPQAQILKNDHAIFTINCSNANKRRSFGEWTVLKRFAEFHAFDIQLRTDLLENQPHALQLLPNLPTRQPKLLIDHLDESFIERRRLLTEAYLKRLIRHSIFRKHPITLKFLGVDL